MLSSPRSKGFDPATVDRFSSRGKTITVVDGSIVKTLARVAGLSWIKVGDGNLTCGYRLYAQFEILRSIPNRIDATSADPKGPADERVVLEQTLESDRLYLMDWGYSKFALRNAIYNKQSGYICRVRDKFDHHVIEERPLNPADEGAGVLADHIIAPNSKTAK